jgi:putative salt-induced outer membrane protein
VQIRKLLMVTLLTTMSFMAYAQEAEPEQEAGPWSGNILLGYLATGGNTENSSVNFDFGVKYDVNRWHHGLDGRFFSSKQNNQSTAENYRLGWNSKFDFTEFNYGVGRLQWKRDRFSGYEYQRFATLSYGRRIIQSARQKLDAEIGAGWTQSEEVDNNKISEGVIRLYGAYDLNITDTSKFSQTLEVTAGSSNTYTESITALRTAVLGALGLTVSYTIQNNSDVVPGVEKTDTITAVGLDYQF